MLKFFKKSFICTYTGLLILFLVSCTQTTTVTSTAILVSEQTPSQTPLLPTATPVPFTPTTMPSPTQTITVTLEPTQTMTLQPTLGFTQEGLTAWCLPEHSSLSALDLPLTPPENANIGKMIEGQLEINNLPVSGCVFVYHMNSTAPSGLKLEIYDNNPSGPWLTTDLTSVEGNPNNLATALTHTYIIAPPYWNISYQFSIKDASGTELRRDQVNLHRWVPQPCWNGRLPNPLTLICPLPQDLHPWDPWYLTPMPTGLPE